MPQRKLGHLQLSVLELAERHEGRVWPELIYKELFASPVDEGDAEGHRIKAETKNTVSRVLWSLEKRGLIRRSGDGRSFEMCRTDEQRS
ncbi:MAG: hypothetical protein EOP84_06735 [Verrucomicrobiaceae bacterium]|nr:MAG: hypothetical protein EOP84_06735 [Verrucomicrobiaceae bacterium]